MSDRCTVLLAALAWLGAAIGMQSGAGPPVIAAALAVLAALLVRRPPLVLAAVALLTLARGASDARGLSTSVVGPVSGWATLVTDPESHGDATVRAELRLEGDHVLATAHGEAAAMLAPRSAGERVLISGRATRAPPTAVWLAPRHIASQVTIDEINGTNTGPLVAEWANGFRHVLEQSAHALPDNQRGLYLGFVLGDDRTQPVEIVDDFRGSGLSHLLAVSGQNVAFVLTLAGPALRWLMYRPRWAATIAVIGLFAFVARFEPSVLRASVMAGLAATAAMLGRPASGVRLLALAVTALLVVDPFLVDSVGFRLSVAASAAIVLLSRPLAARLPGPRVLADTIAVSIAARLGVAPILVTTFGGAPVAGIVANVLVAPAAGPVMVWGLAAGLVGGLLGSNVAAVVHLPTLVLIGWVALVAERTARWPLGELGVREIGAVIVGCALVAAGIRTGPRVVKAAGFAVIAIGVMAPAMALARAAPELVRVNGSSLWRAGNGAVLVVEGRTRTEDLLAGLRAAGADRVDLAVVTVPGLADMLEAVETRVRVGAVVRPGDLEAPVTVQYGALEVRLEPVSGGLRAVVREAGVAAGARDPPV